MSLSCEINPTDVSVIIPVYNAEAFLDDCLASIHQQKIGEFSVEISIFLDSCTDRSLQITDKWRCLFEQTGFRVTVNSEDNESPKGVGYAKNMAVRQSSGQSLCFMDADDVMHPDRMLIQYKLLPENPDALIGSGFTRTPADSTRRYTAWANNLTPEQLYTQAYTSHGPTVIMPTWFCSRATYDAVGEFSEVGRGEPEDLIFFYQHLRRGGSIVRAPGELITYRYLHSSATQSVKESRIWSLRVAEVCARVLRHWPAFTIWNAGKQGRKLYRSMPDHLRQKVVSFCDVDVKKLGKNYTYEECDILPRPTVPIVHFSQAAPPFIICVKMDLTGGQFEENLKSLNLKEGVDYYHFN